MEGVRFTGAFRFMVGEEVRGEQDTHLHRVAVRSGSGARTLAAGLALLLGLAGCASKPTGGPPRPGSEAARLYETDTQFAAQARVLGVPEAFRQFLAERAVQLPNGELPVQGRQAIYEHQLQAGNAQLFWEPVAAEVARSGELGYTWGFYEVHLREPDGTVRTGHGKYTTIWEKQPDGAWKVILDTGNPGPPPPPAEPSPRRARVPESSDGR